MIKWEYMTLSDNEDVSKEDAELDLVSEKAAWVAKLNKLGKEGWELVCVTSASNLPFELYGAQPSLAYFKRKIK